MTYVDLNKNLDDHPGLSSSSKRSEYSHRAPQDQALFLLLCPLLDPPEFILLLSIKKQDTYEDGPNLVYDSNYSVQF